MSPFFKLIAVIWFDSSIFWSSNVVLLRFPADRAIFCLISAWKSGTAPFNVESMPFDPFLRPRFFGGSFSGSWAGCCGGRGGVGWTTGTMGTISGDAILLMKLLVMGLTGDGSFFKIFLRFWLLSFSSISSLRLPNSFDDASCEFPFCNGICVIGDVIGLVALKCDFGRRLVKLVGPLTIRSWLMGGDCECCVMNWVSDEPWDMFWGEFGCDDWEVRGGGADDAKCSFHFRKRFLIRLARAWSLPLFCLKAWRSLIIRVFCEFKEQDGWSCKRFHHLLLNSDTHLNFSVGFVCDTECFETWYDLYDC